MDPNARVQIIETPVAQPGICMMCRVGGGVDSRKFIDFGMQEDWYGQVIFCEYCMASVAEAVGFISSIEMETVKALAENISKKVDNLNNENQVLRNAMVELCRSNSIDSGLIERLVDSARCNEPHEGTSPTDGGGEQETDESNSKQGSKRVRSATGTKSAG